MKLSRIAKAIDACLLGKGASVQGWSIDTRSLKPGQGFVALPGERVDGHDFIVQAEEAGAACILASQPVETQLPVLQVRDTLQALKAMAVFYREQFTAPVIAITGSYGKTTIKTMVRQILEVAGYSVISSVGNQNNLIGLPLSLCQLHADYGAAVFECGTGGPGDMAQLAAMARPTIAVICNAGPAHLETLGTVEGVAHEKAALLTSLAADGQAVLNADDTYGELWATKLSGQQKLWRYSLHQESTAVWASAIQPSFLDGTRFTAHTPQGELPISLPLLGEHQVMNALAAITVGLAMHCPLEAIAQGLSQMQPVKQRMQTLEGPQGCLWIEDGYNANPESVKAAIDVLAGFEGERILLLGDMLELGDNAEQYHDEVGRYAKVKGIDSLLALGSLTKKSVQAFGVGSPGGAQHFSHAEDLVKVLAPGLNAKTCVLTKGSRSMAMEQIYAMLGQSSFSN